MSSRRAACSTVVMALTLLGFAHPALTQEAAGGAIVQSYSFDDPEAAGLSEYRLLTAPFAVAIPLGGRVSLMAGGAWAKGEATGSDGATATLEGLTDTEVGLALALGPDRFVVTAGAALPTGKSTHTLTEAAVAGVVAAELLPFAITTWGSGGGAGGDLAVAFQSGPWGIGLAGGDRKSVV